jgi:hypothetical protein
MSEDKELEERVKLIQALLKHLTGNDPLGVVIRGHQYIESALTRLWEEGVPHPKAIDFAKLHFPTRVGLVVALGLLSREPGTSLHSSQ